VTLCIFDEICKACLRDEKKIPRNNKALRTGSSFEPARQSL
jgi:hypothetical protein